MLALVDIIVSTLHSSIGFIYVSTFYSQMDQFSMWWQPNEERVHMVNMYDCTRSKCIEPHGDVYVKQDQM